MSDLRHPKLVQSQASLLLEEKSEKQGFKELFKVTQPGLEPGCLILNPVCFSSVRL